MITNSATNCSLLAVSPQKFLFHFFKDNIVQINNDLLNREKRYLSDENELNLYIVNTVFHRLWEMSASINVVVHVLTSNKCFIR